ncbi:MAG: serine/threonine protein kinase [Gemmataceae bacterium]|nr:serine/threonine protein kinase [Gemmataceae bacterium]
MVSTELGACEWFVWDLRRSNLLDRGRLDQIVGEFLAKNPRAEPPALSEYLVRQNILTQFQAERLLQGKTQGFVLGPFTLMDALGAGSMGTVYKAQSKTDNNWYAVKVLPRRSMWNVRIARRKVRSFEHCRHPAVVPFVDVGTAGGMHYLAWPLVEGESLEKMVEDRGRLPADFAAHIALQIAEGLDVCHQQGLIHGLLKPSNVMIGADNQIFILDFGIGCLLAETEGESLVDTMSTANSVTSGLDCASPESIMDPTNLTPAGDQYSLGCVLYYMLCGQYPFPEGNAAEKMMAHQFQQPKPLQEQNPDLPPPLVEIVERLMQKAPDARYGSVGEAIEALRPLASAGNAPAPAPRPVLKKPEPMGRVAVTPVSKTPLSKTPSAPAPAAPVKASPAKPAAKLPGPSSPTPRPQTIGSLPTREARTTPRAAAPSAPAPAPVAAEPEPVVKPRKERVIPGAVTDDEATDRPDDQLGPLGIALSAGVACALVYFLAVLFRVF